MANFSSITQIALGTVVVIVGGVVGLIVLAALAPTYLGALGDFVAVLASADPDNSTGTAAGDTLKEGLAPVFSIAGIVGLLALGFGVIVMKGVEKFKNRGR